MSDTNKTPERAEILSLRRSIRLALASESAAGRRFFLERARRKAAEAALDAEHSSRVAAEIETESVEGARATRITELEDEIVRLKAENEKISRIAERLASDKVSSPSPFVSVISPPSVPAAPPVAEPFTTYTYDSQGRLVEHAPRIQGSAD